MWSSSFLPLHPLLSYPAPNSLYSRLSRLLRASQTRFYPASGSIQCGSLSSTIFLFVYSKSCFFFFFFPLPSTHRFTCHFLKKAFRSPPPPKAHEVYIDSLFIYFWLVTIFIFHLPVLLSFMTGKKFMEEGNSQYMEVITYKNVMWRKGSYLLEGLLVLCSVSWCSPKPGESVWQSLQPGMSTPAKPPWAHPETGKSSFTLTSGRQQAVVSTTHRAANTMSCNCTL